MVGQRMADGHALRLEFVVELFRVFHADPDPCPAASLVSAAKVHDGAIARDAGEIVAAPARVFETK